MPTPINVHSRAQDGDAWKVRVDVAGAVHVLRVRDDADLDRQVRSIEAAKARTVTLGAREVADAVVVVPEEPTQEEIDRAAFVALVADFNLKRKEVANGVGKSTQADVDDAQTAYKAAYIDAYAPLLPVVG